MPETDDTPQPCEFEMDKLVVRLDEVIPSVISMIDGVATKITGLIQESHCWDDADCIDLVLREGLANAIIHGNRSDPKKAVRICVAIQPIARSLSSLRMLDPASIRMSFAIRFLDRICLQSMVEGSF